MKMTKANCACYPVNRRVAGKAYQVQLKQGACLEYKIPVPAYLVLELPGHPPPLGPKWPTELLAPYSHLPG